MLRKVTGGQILPPLVFSVILYCESPVYLNSERLRFYPPINSSCSLPYRCPCMSWHFLLGWIPTGSSKYSQLSKLLPADLSGFAGGERKSRNGEEIIVCDQKTHPPHQLMKYSVGNWSASHQGWPTLYVPLFTLTAKMGHSLPAQGY